MNVYIAIVIFWCVVLGFILGYEWKSWKFRLEQKPRLTRSDQALQRTEARKTQMETLALLDSDATFLPEPLRVQLRNEILETIPWRDYD